MAAWKGHHGTGKHFWSVLGLRRRMSHSWTAHLRGRSQISSFRAICPIISLRPGINFSRHVVWGCPRTVTAPDSVRLRRGGQGRGRLSTTTAAERAILRSLFTFATIEMKRRQSCRLVLWMRSSGPAKLCRFFSTRPGAMLRLDDLKSTPTRHERRRRSGLTVDRTALTVSDVGQTGSS